MASLQLEIVTPDTKVVTVEADYVGIPGVEGEFGVMPNHIPFLSALDIGGLYYKAEGKTEFVFVAGGFAEISNNRVSILAESAELVANIDKTRAEQARERAQKRLAPVTQGVEDVDVLRAEASLKRAINRLNLVSKG